jgi:hypothetical protein
MIYPSEVCGEPLMVGDRDRCLAVGIDDYFCKPLKRAEVLAFLERIAEGRTTFAKPF